MSTMTLEQVRDELRATSDHADSGYDKAWAVRLADAIDAHLCEREAAKVEASKAIVETSCKAAAMEWEGLVFPDAYSIEEADNLRKTMRAALETVAPMLSAQVPDGWLPTPANVNALPAPIRKYIMMLETEADPAGTIRQNILVGEENDMLRAALAEALAEAPKPEAEE